MKRSYGIEACVETLEQAVIAERRGADRIELCSALEAGGLTPDRDLIRRVCKSVAIPIHIMIRPRPGNFIYTKSEIEQICDQIHQFKYTGIEGIVTGTLNNNLELDFKNLNLVVEAARPLKIVFHKAIDLVPNIEKSVLSLISFGKIDGILTSGKASTAWEGRDLLRQLTELSNEKIQIIAAGKITRYNLHRHHQCIGAPFYHGRNIL